MAPVSLEGRSRGQLILVGGLSLAVILVALALILNTAIFTENLASRNDDAIAGQAVGLQQSTTGEIAGAMAQVNQKSNTTSCVGPGPKKIFVQETVAGLSEASSQYSARDGVSGSVDFASDPPAPNTDVTCGTRIYQEAPFSTFERDDGSPDTWTVASNIDNPSGGTPEIREFEMTVDRSPLESTSVSLINRFAVRLDGSNTWRVYIYKDTTVSPTQTVVEVDGPSSGTCVDSSGSETAIDLTGAKVGGSACTFLEDMWADLTSDNTDIDLLFVNSDKVEGAFGVLVGTTVSDDSRFNNAGGIENQKIVYSTEVDFRYRTAGVNYKIEDLRIAPGEYDD